MPTHFLNIIRTVIHSDSCRAKRKKSYSTRDTVSKIRECIVDATVSYLIHSGKIHTFSGFNLRAHLLSLPTWIKLVSEKDPLALHPTFSFLGPELIRKGRHSTVMWLTKLGATKYLSFFSKRTKIALHSSKMLV